MKIDISKKWFLHFADSTFIEVDLPYDALIHEKRYKECPSGEESSFFPGRKYVFKKELSIRKEDNRYFALSFEGVYRNAVVFLNGKSVGANKWGYSEFSIDISSDIKEGKNILEVEVDNSLVPSARFYTGAGIYRPVHLIVKKEREITDVKVTTVDYAKGVINIAVEGSREHKIQIYDGEALVYEGSSGLVQIKNHRLWDEFDPHLYKLVAETKNDREETFFGIRDVSFLPGKGLFVNGKETKLRGACIHSDNGILGSASYKEVEFHKIKLLKDAGFNAIRSAHNPCSRYILEACDAYGVYVIDELYDGWYIPKNYHDHARDFSKEEYQKDIRSMVHKDYNHPSVICYSLGNEVSEVSDQKGLDVLKDMADCVHELDSTRKVTCGINLLICVYNQLGLGIYKDKKNYEPVPLKDNKQGANKKSGSAFFNYWIQKLGKMLFFISKTKRAERIALSVSERLDIMGLNYGSARYDLDYKKYPDRLMVGTETFVNEAPYNYQKMKEIPNLIGDFIWVGFDYLGEAGFGDWTYYSYGGLPLTYGSGAFDLLGNPTASLSYMQVVWGMRKEPVIAVRPVNHSKETPRVSAWKMTNAIENYNFHDCIGQKMVVEAYTTHPYVELFQNGRSLGVRKCKNNTAIFKGKYDLGTLKAVALDENKQEINCSTLSSGGDKGSIDVRLTKEAPHLNDIVFGNIDIVNKEGQLLPTYEKKISVSTNDKLTLLALGSGLSNNGEDYVSSSHHAYLGQLGFAVMANASGEGVISISGEDLEEKKIVIFIKEGKNERIS